MSITQKDLEFQIISWYKEDSIEQPDTSSGSDDSSSDSESESRYKKNNNKDLSKFKIFIFGKDLDEKTYNHLD